MNLVSNTWNGHMLILHHDQPTGAWIVIAIHALRVDSSGARTSGGGTRIHIYPTLGDAIVDAQKLAEGMTYKFAVADIPRGGAKAVIALRKNLDPQERSGLLRRYGELVQQLGGIFCTGPDVGTSAMDMDIIAETGEPYIFGRTIEAGGAGDTGPLTAAGIFSGMQVTCEELFGNPSLQGRRVLVQGAGSVGGALIQRLHRAGAEVSFSDVDANTIEAYRERLGIRFVPTEVLYETPCDIFAPCAFGGVLDHQIISRLQCRAVAGGANNQLATPDDAEWLHHRGILYAPDYVLNAGAGIGMLGIELEGWSEVEAEAKVVETVRKSLRRVFAIAKHKGITTEAAARLLARERLVRDTTATRLSASLITVNNISSNSNVAIADVLRISAESYTN